MEPSGGVSDRRSKIFGSPFRIPRAHRAWGVGMRPIGCSLGSLGRKQFRSLLGAVFGPLGASFGPLGGLLGRLGGLLGLLGGLLGASLTGLAGIFDSWSPSWGPLGLSWLALWPS